MTRLEALEELVAEVEAGYLTLPEAQAWGHHGTGRPGDVWPAFHGSLDAAQSLHEAMLPEWCWSIDRMGQAIVWYPWVEGDALSHEVSNDGAGDWTYTPARAWLIAILRALIAMEKGEG